MVQVHSRSEHDGSIQTLRVHDLLRDLALQKAKEENFLLVYSNPEDKMSFSKTRRVAIHNPDCDQLIMSQNLHTLLCFHNGSMPNCSKKRLLKVVSNGDGWQNISNGDEEESIIELGMFVGLTQFRYLSLRGMLSDNHDQEFFEKVIGRMKFLQTLEVSRLSKIDGNLFEFPKSALNIKTLRHTYNYNSRVELPDSAKLTNLQSIAMVKATQSWEIELPHLPNLRSLELDTKSCSSKAIITFLSKLEHLTNLEIWHTDSGHEILDMRGFPFYKRLQSLTLYYYSYTNLTQLHEDILPCHLIYLKIEHYEFQQDIMPVLEKLPYLKVLYLKEAMKNRKMTCSSGGFGQLEVLNLSKLSTGEWEIEEGAMSILKKLTIFYCYDLGVPQGLQYLTNLQKLEWRKVDDSMATLIRNLCQHVPSIFLLLETPSSDDESTSDDE